MESYKQVILLSCPEKFNSLIGITCSAVIDNKAEFTFDDTKDGIRTSDIKEHSISGKIHTITTASGSKYKFEESGIAQ